MMEYTSRRSLRMHCIRMAVEKVKEGKYEEAIRLLKIIERQHADGSSDVRDFINDLEEVMERRSTLASNPLENNNNNNKNNKNKNNNNNNNIKNNNNHQFSDDMQSIFMESQFLLVQEVLRQKNFYSILNVQQDATEMEIRRSYKRLLLQLHPDKNCSPDAALAFQLVAKAFSVLSDNRKRRKYDESGAYGTNFDGWDESNNCGPKTTKQTSCIQTILNALFSGESSVSKAMSIYGGSGAKALLGSLLAAVFLAFAVSLFTHPSQLYSFSETSKFNMRQVSQRLRIPYYVEGDFLKTYTGDLTKFEHDIETQFVTFINEMCKNERRERENAMARASQSGNRLEYARIFSVRLKSCDILVRLGLLRYPNRTHESCNSPIQMT